MSKDKQEKRLDAQDPKNQSHESQIDNNQTLKADPDKAGTDTPLTEQNNTEEPLQKREPKDTPLGLIHDRMFEGGMDENRRLTLEEQKAILQKYADYETVYALSDKEMEKLQQDWKNAEQKDPESHLDLRQLIAISEARAKRMRGKWVRVPDDPEEDAQKKQQEEEKTEKKK